jgi:hypothetical protein
MITTKLKLKEQVQTGFNTRSDLISTDPSAFPLHFHGRTG